MVDSRFGSSVYGSGRGDFFIRQRGELDLGLRFRIGGSNQFGVDFRTSVLRLYLSGIAGVLYDVSDTALSGEVVITSRFEIEPGIRLGRPGRRDQHCYMGGPWRMVIDIALFCGGADAFSWDCDGDFVDFAGKHCLLRFGGLVLGAAVYVPVRLSDGKAARLYRETFARFRATRCESLY